MAADHGSLWHRWSALSPAQRSLVVRAGFWLPVFSLAVKLVPLHRIMAVLGLHQGSLNGSPAPADADADPARVADVTRALTVVAARTPWTSTCLAQALAGARLLHSTGLTATVTLGVAKGPPGALEADSILAHAWLDHGDVTVIGGARERRYLPVGRFLG